MRNITVRELQVKSVLGRSGLPEYDYVMNPYSGCFHGCIYCFAVDFTREVEARDRWGSTVFVKTNLVEVLKREVASMRRGLVGISSITDPYHFIEGKYGLTRSGLGLLLANGFRVSIQTKSPLVLRDLDILAKYRKSLDVGMTLTTMNEKAARVLEPFAPSPGSRAAALERLSASGVRTWIFVGPIIGGVNDSFEELEKILDVASRTSSRIIYDWYSPYKNATGMMRDGLPGTDERGWAPSGQARERVSRWLALQAGKLGIEINSQKDEWLRRGELGKLF